MKSYIRHSQKQNLLASLSIVSLCLFSSNIYSAESIKQYKGADLIKFEQKTQTEYLLPLTNLKKSARTWIPIRAKQVEGDVTSSLFKFGRAESLEPIFSHYREQIAKSVSILYECNGRTCGSSNAWANNFFNDYRLYGADANQSLLVVENDANNQYQVLYLNRRGAGDIVLRLDTIDTHLENEDADIAFQVSVNNKIGIRRYLDSIRDDGKAYVVITSSASFTPIKAFDVAQQHIEAIKLSLGQEISEKMTFINLGNQAISRYGANQISVLISQHSSSSETLVP